MIKKARSIIGNILGIRKMYKSETSKVRHLVLPYCVGFGCDIGFGGDKIKKENCLGIDFKKPYAFTGRDKVDIACDLMNEKIPVQDNHFDYVYSSHLIEDFDDTTQCLKELIRILKSNGNLILVFPDQQEYEKFCLKTNQNINTHHKHKEMGLEYMISKLNLIKKIKLEVLYSNNCSIDYNVILVTKIIKID